MRGFDFIGPFFNFYGQVMNYTILIFRLKFGRVLSIGGMKMNLDQHPKRGILKDVDISTLLRMRDEGMTQREIAECFGVSQNTISKKIGTPRNRPLSAPSESAAPRISIPQNWEPVKVPEAVKEKPIVPEAMPLSKFEARGKFFEFDVDVKGKAVTVENMIFSFENLPDIVKDFQNLQKTIEVYGGSENG